MTPGRAGRAIQGFVFAVLLTPLPLGTDSAVTFLPAWIFVLAPSSITFMALFWMAVFFFIGYAAIPWLGAKIVPLPQTAEEAQEENE